MIGTVLHGAHGVQAFRSLTNPLGTILDPQHLVVVSLGVQRSRDSERVLEYALPGLLSAIGGREGAISRPFLRAATPFVRLLSARRPYESDSQTRVLQRQLAFDG